MKTKSAFFLVVLTSFVAGFFVNINWALALGESCGYYAEGTCQNHNILSADNLVPTSIACPTSTYCFAPSSPTLSNVLNLSAATPSPGVVVLTWTRPSVTTGLSKYRVYRGSQHLRDITVSEPNSNQPYTFNDLVNPGPYVYIVTALDQNGLQSQGVATPEVRVAPFVVSAVRNLTVREAPIDSGIVEISWGMPSNSAGVGSYIISRINAEGERTPLAQTQTKDILRYTDMTVPSLGQYTYEVRVVDIVGDATASAETASLDVFGHYFPPRFDSYDPYCTDGMEPNVECTNGTDSGRCLVDDSNGLYCSLPSTGAGDCVLNNPCTDSNGVRGTCVLDEFGSFCLTRSYNFPGTGTGGGTGIGGSTPGGFPGGRIGPFDIPSETGMSDASVPAIITNILMWMLGILEVVTVIAFVVSGFQYMLSAGDSGMAETAKKHMIWSIVGVIVAMSGLIIVKAIETALMADVSI